MKKNIYVSIYVCVCVYLGVYNLTLINSSKWTVSIYLIKKKKSATISFLVNLRYNEDTGL